MHSPFRTRPARLALLIALALLMAGTIGASDPKTSDERRADVEAQAVMSEAERAAIESGLQAAAGCPLGNVICAPRTITSVWSGLCLNVLNFAQHNGANVVQATNCAISSSKWYVIGSFNNFSISALHSGKCLNVLNAAQHNGANVVQATDCVSQNSRWKIVHVGWQNGRKVYNIKARHSNQCLNVLNFGLFNGANVVQAQDCSVPSSKWFVQGA